MLAGLAKYRLTLGQARQDDLLGLIKDGAELKPLNLRPEFFRAICPRHFSSEINLDGCNLQQLAAAPKLASLAPLTVR
jgi:hypothetical protein